MSELHRMIYGPSLVKEISRHQSEKDSRWELVLSPENIRLIIPGEEKPPFEVGDLVMHILEKVTT